MIISVPEDKHCIEKLQHHISSGIQIVVFDAKEEKDMDLIASVISEIRLKVLFAGCSGLAEHLAKYLSIKKREQALLSWPEA